MMYENQLKVVFDKDYVTVKVETVFLKNRKQKTMYWVEKTLYDTTKSISNPYVIC